MNQLAVQTSAFSTREEIRSSVSERRDPVFCPKPRRVGLFNSTVNDYPVRSLRWHLSHQTELFDAGNDLSEVVLTKGGYYGGDQSCTQVASSPPFFCGSPPSRVANPLVHDSRFGDEKLSPISPLVHMQMQPPSDLLSTSSSPSSSGRKGGYVNVRPNFGNKPAVRIEGFDCLDRDHRNCSIPALA